MTIVYSDDKSVKSQTGVVHATPRFFDVVDSTATKVITDDAKIIDAYEKAGVPTEKLTKPKTTATKLPKKKSKGDKDGSN